MLSQLAYILGILVIFDLQNCIPISTPIKSNYSLREGENVDDLVKILRDQKKKIESLIYLVSATRLEFVYIISYLSQFFLIHQKAILVQQNVPFSILKELYTGT